MTDQQIRDWTAHDWRRPGLNRRRHFLSCGLSEILREGDRVLVWCAITALALWLAWDGRL